MNHSTSTIHANERVSISGLLTSARQNQSHAMGSREAMGSLLQLYRNYLHVLATSQLSPRLRCRVNASDMVQDAMLAAYRDFRDFRGTTEREFLAWMRQILINCVRQAVDVHVNAKKRDVRKEVPIPGGNTNIDDSMANFFEFAAGNTISPSHECQNRELAVTVADELAKLKPAYRDVIIYRNLQGLSFEEIAGRMNRKVGAVRMLWLRAVDKFKSTCEVHE